MRRVSISGGRQAAELPFHPRMPAVRNPHAVAPVPSEARKITADNGIPTIAKDCSFADCPSGGGCHAGAVADSLSGEGSRAGNGLRAVGDANERDQGWTARDSCG